MSGKYPKLNHHNGLFKKKKKKWYSVGVGEDKWLFQHTVLTIVQVLFSAITIMLRDAAKVLYLYFSLCHTEY